jgi:pyruvate-ferredoxin/flavodoxin oxidoreductase
MKEYMGDPNQKLRCLFDPMNPIMTGVVQNQDSYMKGKIAQRHYYDKVPGAVQEAMDEFYKNTGRRYGMVDSYRMDDAEYALVGMGGMMETAQAAADYMREEMYLKVGVVHVTCFAPFPATQLVDVLKNVKAMTVLERMDNPLAQSNPLVQGIKASFSDALTGLSSGSNGEFKYPKITSIPKIYACSAGLGSRDVTGGHFISIVKNMLADKPREFHRYRHQTRLALSDGETGPPSAGRVLHARPFGRRFRLGHDQQTHRLIRRRIVQHLRAGVSEIRLGEKGFAHDLLPDRRGETHPHAQRTGARRIHPAQRRERLQPRQSARRHRR